MPDFRYNWRYKDFAEMYRDLGEKDEALQESVFKSIFWASGTDPVFWPMAQENVDKVMYYYMNFESGVGYFNYDRYSSGYWKSKETKFVGPTDFPMDCPASCGDTARYMIVP